VTSYMSVSLLNGRTDLNFTCDYRDRKLSINRGCYDKDCNGFIIIDNEY
jgi:hypothetical protein